MSRAVPVAIATLIGLAALASFKSSPGVPAASAKARVVTPSTPAATAPPPPTTRTTAPATISPGTTPTTTRTTPTTTPTPTPTSPPTTPTTAANTTRTIDGDPFDNRYGTVQVEVTLQGSQIVGITALQMPTDRERSAEISQAADPLLRQEVLQAQSAQIDILSGATYTSTSYAQSLQSALDKAGH